MWVKWLESSSVWPGCTGGFPAAQGRQGTALELMWLPGPSVQFQKQNLHEPKRRWLLEGSGNLCTWVTPTQTYKTTPLKKYRLFAEWNCLFTCLFYYIPVLCKTSLKLYVCLTKKTKRPRRNNDRYFCMSTDVIAPNQISELTGRDTRPSESLYSSFCRMDQCWPAKRSAERHFSPVPYRDLLVDHISSLWHKPSKLRQYYSAKSLAFLPQKRTLILQEGKKKLKICPRTNTMKTRL